MTQLENIISHFKDLAYHLKETGNDTPEYKEICELLDQIEDGKITLDTLIEDHRKAKGYFIEGWNLGDIEQQAGELEEELTAVEIKKVADIIVQGHDASVGVNWDVISDVIGMVVRESRRIYLVDYCNYEFDTNIVDWDDDKFISEAEIQGNVYTLKGFEKSFNKGEIVSESFIRIFKVHKNETI